MNLSVCVQTHPKRAHLIPALLDRLGHAQIVVDPDPQGRPSPLRTYRLALEMTPEGATHRLVVQDDAWPCAEFRLISNEKIAERPDQIIAFFLGGAPRRSADAARRAHEAGESWSELAPHDWCPTVATVWPVALIPRFLAFIEGKRLAVSGDDNAVGAWTRAEKIPVAVTVPSLVEHPDVEASLIGRRAGGGKNRFRVAAVPPPL